MGSVRFDVSGSYAVEFSSLTGVEARLSVQFSDVSGSYVVTEVFQRLLLGSMTGVEARSVNSVHRSLLRLLLGSMTGVEARSVNSVT